MSLSTIQMLFFIRGGGVDNFDKHKTLKVESSGALSLNY